MAEGYIRWFVKLQPFYQILLGVAIVFGITSFFAGIANGNVYMFALAALWLVGGPLLVAWADRRESTS